MKRMIRMIVLAAAAFILSGCGMQAGRSSEKMPGTESSTSISEVKTKKDPQAGEQSHRTVFAMDTYMELTAYGSHREEALQAAEEEILRLDRTLTSEGTESEIARVNAAGAGTVSQDTAELLTRALGYAEETGGAFDIAIYPMMALWGFTGDSPAVPDAERIRELLPLCDPALIDFHGETGEVRFLREGVKIDLGGIAKGYTSSRVMEIFLEKGVVSGMVNLGGNVQTLGQKPGKKDWRIAIQDPYGSGDMLGIIAMHDKAAITSGGYERFFEEDGKHYHHIIDPETGYPAESGLLSVTIVSAVGTLADALSTSLFVMGKDNAVDFWRTHRDSFDMVLYTDQDEMYVSEGLEGSFTSKHDYTVVRAEE